MDKPALAVIIATKNRPDALARYALPSLAASDFQDFVCLVWDASTDDASRLVAERAAGHVEYVKAPRVGSASQRNDAVAYALSKWPDVRYFVFMDDDAALSYDALSGVIDSFRQDDETMIVNMRMTAIEPLPFAARAVQRLRRALGLNRHGATAFLHNYGGLDEPAGIEVEWASGCMGVRAEVFKEIGGIVIPKLFFPEEFERFGGYALGEDFAFSFFLSRVCRGRIRNAVRGSFKHYAAGAARLDVENMAAAKWYNFHLLFNAVYEGVKGPRRWCLTAAFEAFMCAAALMVLVRAKSLDLAGVLRGIKKARAALRDERGGELFKRRPRE